MKHNVTIAIVLSRVNYGEADRILTVLTPDNGKLSLMARGVRREKSKLAGGVELFSISEITFLPGRGELATLTSSRPQKHFSHITSDLDRTMLGYEVLKIINKITESHAGQEYFDLVAEMFDGLNTLQIAEPMLQLWFNVRLLQITGHTPNLLTDTAGKALQNDQTYHFQPQDMTFEVHPDGTYKANHIKILRLAAQHSLRKLGNVTAGDKTIEETAALSTVLCDYYLNSR